MIDALLTMRATVTRSIAVAGSSGSYGRPQWDDLEVYAALPCYVWVERSREVIDENRSATIVNYRLICAADVDLQDNDRITLTGNRGLGAVPTDAELLVTGKPIKRRDHLDAMLKLVE